MANTVTALTAGMGLQVTDDVGNSHRVGGVVLIDPTTGAPYAAGGGGGGGGTSDTTEATQLQVRTAVQNLDTDFGTPGDAAAGSDTASATLMSFVKRGLQRWTALLAVLPASLGAKTSAASLSVTVASDQSAVPVAATARARTGRQTLALTAGVVTTLTVPANSVAAAIQADGNTIRVTLSGADPTATVGTRIDDGVIYYVDTSLAAVKLLAPVATTAQIAYFDRA